MKAIKRTSVALAIRSLETLAALLDPVYEKLKLTKALYYDFEPKDDDVFIVTYAKSGTSWTAMMLYQLLSDGNMDFDHIRNVVPFIEQRTANIKAIEQVPLSPRVYATHLNYNQMPKGNRKYIYVMRNGMDVLVSGFHNEYNRGGYQGSFFDFFHSYYRGVGKNTWSGHIQDWTENKNNFDILYIRYEDMKCNLDATIRQVAGFLNLDLSPGQLQRVLTNCSFEYMKEHENKFSVTEWLKLERNLVNADSFIRKGVVGDGKSHFTPEMLDQFLRNEFSRCGHNEYLRRYRDSIIESA